MLENFTAIVPQLENLKRMIADSQSRKKEGVIQCCKSISEELQILIKNFKEGESTASQVSFLNRIAFRLPDVIKHIISENEAIDMAGNLISILYTPLTEESIPSIEALEGEFRAIGNLPHIFREGNNLISRRNVLSKIAVGVGAGAAVGIGLHYLLNNRGDVEWTMGTTFQEAVENTIIFDVPHRLCKMVSSMTNDRFRIKLERSGNTASILNAVSSGEIESGFAGIYYGAEQNWYPLYFRSAIPFGLNAWEQIAWLDYLASKNQWLEYYKKTEDSPPQFPQGIENSIYEGLGLKIIGIPLGTTGSQPGGWFREEIKSLEDLKKGFIRIPGLGGQVLRRLGVKTQLDYGTSVDIVQAVEKFREGDFLGIEWTGPYDDIQLGIDRDITLTDGKKRKPFFYHLGWQEPFTTFDLQINIEEWEKLPTEYKYILEAACRNVFLETWSRYTAENARVFDEVIKKDNFQVLSFNSNLLETIKEANKARMAELEEQDEKFAAVYQEWTKFRERIRAWYK